MIKISKSILSITPYISTQWSQISSLSFDEKNNTLIVALINGSSVSIPKLEQNVIQQIFSMHAKILQGNEEPPAKINSTQANINIPFNPSNMQLPGLDSIANIMQHDPTNKDAPDLPKEVLEKVTIMRQTLNLDDSVIAIPEAHDNCNCFHCQVTRALHGKQESKTTPHDEPVDDSELKFKEWEINNVGKDLFNVSNPLDEKEHYQVYLGKENMGCTCGKENCPHLIAVLKSDV